MFTYILFIYGSDDIFIFFIYLISLLSYIEWLRITSKSVFFTIPFFLFLIIVDIYDLVSIDIFFNIISFFDSYNVYTYFWFPSILSSKYQKIFDDTRNTSYFFILYFSNEPISSGYYTWY